MKLLSHGGKCCGVTHLYLEGDSTGPEGMSPALEALHEYASLDARQAWGLYKLKAPKESSGDRLKRFVRFLEASRPSGIIEIVLPGETIAGYYDQNKIWGAFICELGFKEVTVWKNSNSSRMLHVYHRCSGSPEAPPIPPETAKPKADPFG